jgi:hypothetical protein
MTVTGSAVMNPFAGGGQNNLYRCFIDLSFRTMSPAGYAALIHQDGHLTDPRAGMFRRAWYARVVKHFDFLNVIKTKNFSEVAHYARFSLNIYSAIDSEIDFTNLTYVFLPSQVEDSFNHDGAGPVPTFKDYEGAWDTRGHRDRIVRINQDALAAIHALTEDVATPVEEARLLQPYSTKMLDVFRALALAPSLANAVTDARASQDVADGSAIEAVPGWQMSSIWHESGAQKEGIIQRNTGFRDDPAEVILSGPMFHVGNPFYKTPKAMCRTKADYELIELSCSPDDYLPRTNYVPAMERTEYLAQLPRCRWEPTKSLVDLYRVAFRRRINLNSERSLIPALLPPGICHVHTVESVAFRSSDDLIAGFTLSVSVILDYLVKASGVTDFHAGVLANFPWAVPASTAKHRGLRLACLTTAYENLWNEHAHTLNPLPWHSSDPRLALDGPAAGPASWDSTAALRTDFARRMALVEIDVLVSQALGLTLDQLTDIYRIYFPVLQQNEAGTWYDRNGRIVWTCSKGLPGIGFLEDGRSPSSRRWQEFLKSGKTRLECEAVVDFTPGGPRRVTRTFEGPFDTCDRVEDYKRAWAYFEKHQEQEAAA